MSSHSLVLPSLLPSLILSDLTKQNREMFNLITEQGRNYRVVAQMISTLKTLQKFPHSCNWITSFEFKLWGKHFYLFLCNTAIIWPSDISLQMTKTLDLPITHDFLIPSTPSTPSSLSSSSSSSLSSPLLLSLSLESMTYLTDIYNHTTSMEPVLKCIQFLANLIIIKLQRNAPDL